MKSKSLLAVLISVVIAALILLALFAKYYGDWLWFKNLGYASVFMTMFWTKIGVFLLFFVIFALFAWLNIAIARKLGTHTRSMQLVAPDQPLPSLDSLFKEKYAKYVWGVIILFFSIIMGLGAVSSWETFLKFFHATSFGISDPIFSKDIGFYIFKLPLYKFIQGWYLYMLFLVFMGVGLSYYFDQSISLLENRFYIYQKAKYHIAILGGFFFLGIAWVYRLKLYGMLYSTRGVAYGASYTDVHAQIPGYWILMILTLIAALFLFLVPMIKKWKWVTITFGAYFLLLIGLLWIYPGLIQQYVVKPNELAKEKPYIKNNIFFTRKAYGLNKVEEKIFPANQGITYKDIQNNDNTIRNIRLWDRRPLIQTYKQLQEIRLYYDFKNVDVDRYHFDKYTEVALAARELPQSQIPSRARTWVNMHLIYTHGFGAVMSPVNKVTPNGMPDFIIKNIPSQSSVPLSIRRPQIYYGEETDEYALVNTKTKEFDYPKGNDNVYTSYEGNGGVRISSLLRRAVYAWNFSDIKILLTSSLTKESRIIFNRIITDRDQTIAPFLAYDSDPYLVIGDNGRLYWIHDAYTTSNMFPYSEPVSQLNAQRGLNYIRNSVKVVIDAYNGDVTYYVIEPKDPLIQTYQKIFPKLFRPFAEMPDFLKKHIRYPADIFLIQTQIYNTYHMTDPQVFYNREDYWNIPTEIYQEDKQLMFPYYIIMKLPNHSSEEFILMLPLTPSKKDNMVAWMCAQCDAPNYGKMIVYALPKEKLIYGPMQIEARINQKPDISSELTLWGQKGSRVIRGNLLVIPIEQSFIYVEPVYLQSEQSQMPELKRVIVAFSEQLEMRTTLDQALQAVFLGENISPAQTKSIIRGKQPIKALSSKAQQALDIYNKAIEYLKQGNWAEYGQELNQLKQILEDLAQKK